MAIEGFAPAKVNLTLHVIGRRSDGYHLLDSLAAFVDCGDVVHAQPAQGLSLRVAGPRAAGLSAGEDNLVMRAARLLARQLPLQHQHQGAAMVLEKTLPPASGLGGGSSDAAAALRVLSRLWRVALPDPADVLPLGADVPICLTARPARMRDIGGTLEPVPDLPPAWLVLVNPGVAVPTPAVFAALGQRENPPMPQALPLWPDADALAQWLREMRNDLELPAVALYPVITQALAALAQARGCLLARMSGSGASCFGLFADQLEARAAQTAISAAQPGWWVESAALLRVSPSGAAGLS